jgi:replicative DNA helicase
VVLFIYRPSRYGQVEEHEKNRAEIIIGKQRNGPTGTVELVFLDHYAAFENLETYHEDPMNEM